MASNRNSIRKFLSAAQNRMLAVFIIAAIVVNNLMPRAFITLLDNEDLSRIIASESVLTDFFYHATLPIKIVNKVLQGMNMSGNKAMPCPASDQQDKPNTSTDSATLAPAAGSCSRDIGNMSTMGIAHFAAFASFCYFDVLLKSCPCPDVLLFLTLMILFFFLLPRSSVSEDAILLSVIKGVVMPGLRYLKPGIFFDRNCNQTAPGRQQ